MHAPQLEDDVVRGGLEIGVTLLQLRNVVAHDDQSFDRSFEQAPAPGVGRQTKLIIGLGQLVSESSIVELDHRLLDSGGDVDLSAELAKNLVDLRKDRRSLLRSGVDDLLAERERFSETIRALTRLAQR